MSIVARVGHRFLLASTLLLLALNGFLLWRDYQQKEETVTLEARLYDAQITLRALETEKVFGASFVPLIETVDLNDDPWSLPYFGKQPVALLFFKMSDCVSCIEAVASFKDKISGIVPVIGIAATDSVDEARGLVLQYNIRFQVAVAKRCPFNLYNSPYLVLVDRNRTVRYMTSVNPMHVSVAEIAREVVQLFERR